MSFTPNTTGHLNWLLALLTTALLCVGALTVAAGLYLIVR
jgi:hypothetical protein